MNSRSLTHGGLAVLVLMLLLPLACAAGAENAALQVEIENFRKAALVQFKDRKPDNFEDYVRETATRNYYQRQFIAALVAADMPALTNVLKEFPAFARSQFLHSPLIQAESPLAYAVKQGHRAIVEVLLAHNAGPDRPRTGLLPPYNLEPPSAFPPGAERRDTPLHLALRGGRVEIARLLLQAGANLEALDAKGETPLSATVRLLAGSNYRPDALPAGSAVRAQQEELLTLLLQHGARVWSTNRYASAFQPPFDLVVSARDEELLDRLLTQSVHLAATNHAGSTLVHLAVSYGRLSALKTLLARQVSMTATNTAGFTPLETAAWLARVDRLPSTPGNFNSPAVISPVLPTTRAGFVRQESANLLLAAGAVADAHSLAGLGRTNELATLLQREPAQVNAPDGGGRRPLHYAVHAGDLAAMALLLQAGAGTEPKDRDGQTPLLAAVSNRQVVEANALLKAGAQVATTNAMGQTPLHLAVSYADTNFLAVLHQAGAELNARDAAGRTPVEVAAQIRRFDLVNWLRAHGATIPAQTDRRMTTALHEAVTSGHLPAVQKMLVEGAERDARDEQGRTPLRRAVDVNRTDLAQLLLAHGANPNLADTNGITPLRARFFGAVDSVTGPVPKPGFSKRPEEPGAPKSASPRLATLPPELRATTVPAQPPLTNLLLVLLESGADPRLPDAKGNTILHALQPVLQGQSPQLLQQHVARARLLTSYGLAVDTPSADGLTPLQLAAARADLIHAFALLEAGADVNTPDRQGRTVLHHALAPQMSPNRWQREPETRRDLPRTLALLLDNGADLRRGDTNGATALHLLPAMDDALRGLVLPVLKTNRHFAAALRLKDKSGRTPILAGFEELRAKPFPSVAKMLATLLASGGELPPVTDHGSTTVLHELAGVDTVRDPFFGANQPDTNATATIVNLAAQAVAQAARVDVRNVQGETPLHIATRHLNTAFATALLARGADPNAQNQQGDTPLHLALRSVIATSVNHPVIPLLISNRCDLTRRNAAGETPLRMETTRRFYGTGPLFLPPGATQGFFFAARDGDLQSLDAYLSLDPALATLVDPATQASALRAAALAGQQGIAARLRNAGATDPVSAAVLGWTNSLAVFLHSTPHLGETNSGFGMPLLHLAASRGQVESVRILLTESVSPGLEDALGRTALYHATTNGNASVIALLIARGARPSLFDAIAQADRQLLDTLLAAEPALVNATNRMLFTPLLAATDLGNLEIVRRLLAHGADPNRGYMASPRIFQSRFFPGTVALHLAAWSNRVDLAEALVAAKANFTAINERGYSTLHFAVARGHREMTAWLLDRGADPNVQTVVTVTNSPRTFPPMNPNLVNHGWTPLHLAVRYGHPALIELLVARGAKLEATDSLGRTPADLTQRQFELPWPPSPYRNLAPGTPIVDPSREPAHMQAVLDMLKKLGAVMPLTRVTASFNTNPQRAPVTPVGTPPATK